MLSSAHVSLRGGCVACCVTTACVLRVMRLRAARVLRGGLVDVYE